MAANRLKSSLVALGFVAVIALGFVLFAKKMSSRSSLGSSLPSASSAPPSASVVATMGKDICAHAEDRCACATEHAAELLAASFAERAMQLMSRAPATCHDSKFLGVRAEALAAIERTDDAARAATAAIQAEPGNRFARRARAIVAIQLQDYATADTTLDALIKEEPKDTDSLFYRALSQRRRNRYNGAREGFLQVLRLNPQHIDARFNLVTLTAAAGAAQEAEHDYEELEQITPVGDARLIAARTALRGADKNAPAELPVLYQGGPTPTVAPSR